MNGVACRDCGKDHKTMHEAYLCDMEIIKRLNHVSDCACYRCVRVMMYEDAMDFYSRKQTEPQP